MDGIYEGKIAIPNGNVDGRIILKTEGRKLTGYIETMGTRSYFHDGFVNGNMCEFSGVINYFMVKIIYKVQAKLENTKLFADVITNKGNFKITATKIDWIKFKKLDKIYLNY